MIDPYLAPRAGLAYVLLRFVSGVMFAFQGAQKVLGLQKVLDLMARAQPMFTQLDENALPSANGGELALLFCVLFLFIACQGRRSKALDGPGK